MTPWTLGGVHQGLVSAWVTTYALKEHVTSYFNTSKARNKQIHLCIKTGPQNRVKKRGILN